MLRATELHSAGGVARRTQAPSWSSVQPIPSRSGLPGAPSALARAWSCTGCSGINTTISLTYISFRCILPTSRRLVPARLGRRAHLPNHVTNLVDVTAGPFFDALERFDSRLGGVSESPWQASPRAHTWSEQPFTPSP